MTAGQSLTRTPSTREPAAALLAWYDAHRRDLPWRARPGETADPYRVWLSEIMLQQTTVQAVKPYFQAFLARWPNVEALAAAPLDDVLKAWAGLGYYARARNLHACAIAVATLHGGRFPSDLASLRALPGVGDYTAAAVASIAFHVAAPVVDGNVERVVARLDRMTSPPAAAKAAVRARVAAMLDPARPGDFAQAMMDLGATVCTPRSPSCLLCPLSGHCAAAAAGDQTRYPVKPAKRARPLRRGAVFAVFREDGALLVRRRADKGLLGGMTELPGSPWAIDFDGRRALDHAPIDAPYARLAGAVSHVFTHFPLELTVYAATVDLGAPAPGGAWWLAAAEIESAAFPTLMRKAIAHALDARNRVG